MRKKRTSNALKGIASCMICAWSLCACGNVAEDSSDRKVMEESKAAEYEALFDEIEAITPYKSLSNTNPIMTQRFGADPYAMVYKDRVYFYMTGDTFEYDADGSVTENTYGKINTISVVSTTDMVNFEDHGTVYAAGSKGAAKWAANSWAPAAAWKEIDGEVKFFLYFAYADNCYFHTPNCADVIWIFDPAVLVDDDGRAYLYFGGGVPEGQAANPGTARVVELGEDMISIAGEPVIIDAPYVFEDSGIHKYNNKYYYTYCSNWDVDQAGTDQYGFESGEIVCMESESPLGPFTIKETILENPGKYFGLGGNNHHCVFSFKDHWYITYHTRVLEGNMGIEKGYRCTHIDSFTMQKDGSIGLIDQTLQGREQLSYVDAYQRHSATEVAVMSGMSTVAGDAVTDFYGSGTMALGKIQTGSFVKVQGVDFGEGAPSKWIAEIKNANGEVGVIQLRADGLNGDILGYLTIDANTGTNYAEFETNLNTGITGVHDVYMIFYGEEYEVLSWQFEK